jgi:hypothetical protein
MLRGGVGSLRLSVRTDQPAAGCRGARRSHDTRAASRARRRWPGMQRPEARHDWALPPAVAASLKLAS